MKIFAIELTNHCNAKCSFCPWPTDAHTRPRGFMDLDTLNRIITVMEEPREINISGLGEPLLHKRHVDYVRILSENGVRVQMNTNGKKLDQGTYDRLVGAGLQRLVITADYFPWDKGQLRVYPECPVQLLTITRPPDHPELGQVQKPLDDWGGQVGKVDRPNVRCSFLHDNFYQICWDGTIQRCCVDFDGTHRMGNVHQDHDVETCERHGAGYGIPLCSGCHGYVFTSGFVAGDYAGEGKKLPDAFVPLESLG